MDGDYERLQSLPSISNLSFHFYDWAKPSLTYGYFIDPEEKINIEALHKLGWEMARRPTGGGVILHPYDLAFAVVIPAGHPALTDNTLENYAFVNAKVADAINAVTGLKAEILKLDCECNGKVNFCMAKPTQYDVIIEGKKVAGAAQRKTKQGILHQGSICLQTPDNELLAKIIKDKTVIEEMQKNSYPLGREAELHLRTTLIQKFS